MNTKTPEQVYLAIAADLRENAMTYSDAAQLTGYKTQTIANIISGRKDYLSKKQAQRFSNGLGYSEDFLLYGRGVLRQENEMVNAIGERNSFMSDTKRLTLLMGYIKDLALMTNDKALHFVYKKFYRSLTTTDYEESQAAILDIQDVLEVVATTHNVHLEDQDEPLYDEADPDDELLYDEEDRDGDEESL